MDAEDFLLMRYNCQDVKDTIKYLSLEDITTIFKNFMGLNMIPEMDSLSMKEVT